MSEQRGVRDEAAASDQYVCIKSVAVDQDGDKWCPVATRDANTIAKPMHHIERDHE